MSLCTPERYKKYDISLFTSEVPEMRHNVQERSEIRQLEAPQKQLTV
jgi:hypothetical protein